MRRLAICVAIGGLLASNVGGAAAQIDRGEPTSIEPLAELIASIETGTAGDAIVSPGGGPIVSQFQVVTNLGRQPAFFEPDLELTPVGWADGAITDLSSYVGSNFEAIRQIPPLDGEPDILTSGPRPEFDLATVFAGWEAFGEAGPTAAPTAYATNTMLWGFELAEPFDTTCGSRMSVGRAWESQSVVSANAPFNAAVLDEIWPGTHGALAEGNLGRLIQLGCVGSTPTVEAMRMNPDLGRIRPFGPLNIVAFVKGNFVVFVGDLTETDDHARAVTFFASGASGAVETIAGSGPIPALVPNPYGAVPDRIDFVFDPSAIEPIGLAHDEGVDENLVYRGERRGAKSAGSSRSGQTLIGIPCDLAMVILYVGTGGSAPLTIDTPLWSPQASVWRAASVEGDVLTSVHSYPDGSTDELTMNLATGEFTVVINGLEASCIVVGVFTVNGATVDGVIATPSPDADSGDSDEAAECVGSECDDLLSTPECEGASCPDAADGGSGPPWGAIGFGVVGVGGAAAAYVALGRRKEPLTEEEAATRPRDEGGAFVLHPNATINPDDWPEGSEFIWREDGSQIVIVPAGADPLADLPDRWSQGPDYSHPAFGMTADELSGHVFEAGNTPDPSAAPADHVLVVHDDGTSSFEPDPDLGDADADGDGPDSTGNPPRTLVSFLPGPGFVPPEPPLLGTGDDLAAEDDGQDAEPTSAGEAVELGPKPDASTWTEEEATEWIMTTFTFIPDARQQQPEGYLNEDVRFRSDEDSAEVLFEYRRPGSDEWVKVEDNDTERPDLVTLARVFTQMRRNSGAYSTIEGPLNPHFEFARLSEGFQQAVIDAVHDPQGPPPADM